jgi:hypothetical protein
MQEFLKSYDKAVNLDDKSYDKYFPKGISRSDFLLFDHQIVCEFKEIKNIQISNQVEKIYQKQNISEQDAKRNLYNSIEKSLSKANKQIYQTKEALSLQDAFGLVIIENQISSDLSILSLMDAANRKMTNPGGLENVDCILCLDFVNTFSQSDGKIVRPAQIVSRDSERAMQLSDFVSHLMRDFCNVSDTPLLEGYNIEKGDQEWLGDNGKYKNYSAKIDFEPLKTREENSNLQKIADALSHYWWVIPLPFIFYDWFVR